MLNLETGESNESPPCSGYFQVRSVNEMCWTKSNERSIIAFPSENNEKFPHFPLGWLDICVLMRLLKIHHSFFPPATTPWTSFERPQKAPVVQPAAGRPRKARPSPRQPVPPPKKEMDMPSSVYKYTTLTCSSRPILSSKRNLKGKNAAA
jgi:hypothetical protein